MGLSSKPHFIIIKVMYCNTLSNKEYIKCDNMCIELCLLWCERRCHN